MAPPLPFDAPAREQLCLFKIDFDLTERIWFLRTRSRCLEMACAVLRRYWGSADSAVFLTIRRGGAALGDVGDGTPSLTSA